VTMEKTGWLAELERDPWHMEERALHSFMAKAAEVAGRAMPDHAPQKSPAGYDVEPDGTAVIRVHGTLLKSVPSYFARWDISATSYSDIEKQVSAAASDEKVTSIRLDIDSHGGSSMGIKRAGDAIFAARSSGKPVTARIEDVACSAAYWLAAQTQEISAGPMALIGSIGTYLTFYDLERLAKNVGIEVQVISSGALKGAGVPGTRLTPEQKADLQKWVEDLTEVFVGDVARGRGASLDTVKSWATGGAWLGPEAKRMGLVDRVESHQDLRARAAAKAMPRIEDVNKDESAAGEGVRPASDLKDRTPKRGGDTPMTDAELKALRDKAGEDARAEERGRVTAIRNAFGQKDAGFTLVAIEKGMTLDQAKAAWGEVVELKLAEEQKARAESDKKLEAAQKAAISGAAPIATGGDPGGKPAAGDKDFMALSREYAREHKCSMRVAMKAVNDASPGLHEKAQGQWAADAPRVHSAKQAAGLKPATSEQ